MGILSSIGVFPGNELCGEPHAVVRGCHIQIVYGLQASRNKRRVDFDKRRVYPLGMNTSLVTASKLAGSQASLARAVGVGPMHVTNWIKRGVPAGMVLKVSGAVDWRVTPHQLRPDLYPHPDDGLPEDKRRQPQEAA
jgi:hypothetical protein